MNERRTHLRAARAHDLARFALTLGAMTLIGCGDSNAFDCVDDATSAESGLASSVLEQAPMPDATGYVLKQRSQGMDFEITVSNEGIKVVGLSADNAMFTPTSVGAAMRYDSEQLLILDSEAHTYSVVPLDQALSERALEVELAAQATQPGSLEGEVDVGTPPEAQQAGRACLSRLVDEPEIAGHPAQGILLQQGEVAYRFWVARDLPVLPPTLAHRLAAVWSKAAPVNRVVMRNPELFQRMLLRAEIRQPTASGGADSDAPDWVTIVDTTDSVKVELPEDAFDAPAGWEEVDAAPSPTATATQSTSLVPKSVPANVTSGPGPVMRRPELFLVYWGAVFEQHPDFVFAMNTAARRLFNPAYSGPLSSYGIGIDVTAGRGVVGHTISTRPLPRLVGQGDFISISHELWFNSETPKVWWKTNGRDPLVGFFVASDDVDEGGWNGYHFNSLSPSIFLPFPVSFLAFELMPWFVVRVPQGALNAPRTIRTANRRPCYRSVSLATATCTSILSFDAATTTLGHEFVETVTDPFPFSGLSDIFMQPAASDSEVSDICSQGTTDPWGSNAVVQDALGDTVLATYWVNSPPSCVPESRPSLQIINPCDDRIEGSCDGFIKRREPTLFLRADAYDLFVGDLTGTAVRWFIDGTQVATGNPASIPSPAIGEHLLEVTARSQARSQSKTMRFILYDAAPPPVDPCGETAPMCNGTCPPQHVCTSFDNSITCVCHLLL